MDKGCSLEDLLEVIDYWESGKSMLAAWHDDDDDDDDVCVCMYGWGILSLMVIIVRDGISNKSWNTGQGCWHFILC